MCSPWQRCRLHPREPAEIQVQGELNAIKPCRPKHLQGLLAGMALRRRTIITGARTRATVSVEKRNASAREGRKENIAKIRSTSSVPTHPGCRCRASCTGRRRSCTAKGYSPHVRMSHIHESRSLAAQRILHESLNKIDANGRAEGRSLQTFANPFGLPRSVFHPSYRKMC